MISINNRMERLLQNFGTFITNPREAWNSWSFWPSNKIVRKRNLDIGLGDGQISPWLIHHDETPREFTLPEFSEQEQVVVEIIPKLKKKWPADAFPPGTVRLDAQRDLPRLMRRL